MRKNTTALAHRIAPALAAALLSTMSMAQQTGEGQVPAQGSDPDFEQDLEQRVAELERQLDAVAGEVERFELRDVMPVVGEGRWGLGPAASKIYQKDQGLSIGGYGEFLLEAPTGSETDTFDALRAVLYFGYKFDEKWLFNSEIEIEHATTDDSSASTDSSGSVSLEFGYLDYMHAEGLNGRGGLVLVPMGLVNEVHEPTTFLTANRSETELRIIPTTWRAMGLGAFGDAGGFAYRAYVVNGLDGEDFDSSGIRGGRQKGNRAGRSTTSRGVARLDYVDVPGLTAGGSLYYGEADQDSASLPTMETLIYELHVDFEAGPWTVRRAGRDVRHRERR